MKKKTKQQELEALYLESCPFIKRASDIKPQTTKKAFSFMEFLATTATLGLLLSAYLGYASAASAKAISEAERLSEEYQRQIECIELTGKSCPVSKDVEDYEQDIEDALEEFESVMEGVETE